MGGAVRAIEAGYFQDEIHDSAFRIQQGIESGARVIVGVNRFDDADDKPIELQHLADEDAMTQIERLASFAPSAIRRRGRTALASVDEIARGTGNLLPPMKEALRVRATLGEVSDALRSVFGEHHPTR